MTLLTLPDYRLIVYRRQAWLVGAIAPGTARGNFTVVTYKIQQCKDGYYKLLTADMVLGLNCLAIGIGNPKTVPAIARLAGGRRILRERTRS